MTGMTPGALEALSTRTFAGPLGYLAGSLAFSDHPEAIGSDALDDRAVFDALLARFGEDHPGADRRAVTSFWSQCYFSKLTIALTALCFAAGEPLGLEFDSLRVRFCPRQGTALCFHLRCGGPSRDTDALVKALYDEHVAGMVARLKRHGGLSARLCWENAGGYGMWMLGEIARRDPSLKPMADALLSDPAWPRGGCTMMPHLKCAARDGCPAVRRVCCLRYLLPGVGHCGETCPLPPPGGEAAPRH